MCKRGALWGKEPHVDNLATLLYTSYSVGAWAFLQEAWPWIFSGRCQHTMSSVGFSKWVMNQCWVVLAAFFSKEKDIGCFQSAENPIGGLFVIWHAKSFWKWQGFITLIYQWGPNNKVMGLNGSRTWVNSREKGNVRTVLQYFRLADERREASSGPSSEGTRAISCVSVTELAPHCPNSSYLCQRSDWQQDAKYL